MDGCVPLVDWSLCEDDSGYPRTLPHFYILSVIFFGTTGILFLMSMVQTLRDQFRQKRRLNYNTAMQMHVGIVAFSVTAVCHDAALATRKPGMPALLALLFYHSRLMFVEFVTTVLVRHWALLHQQMGKNRPNEEHLNDKIARFVTIYRDGEVIKGVLTCSFFLSTIVYEVRNHDDWEQVERLQFLVWAILSGVTWWLVSILGQRVHVNMRSMSRSRAMIAHVRRMYYVTVGSSFLWFQCTVCFALLAALERPLSAAVWLTLNCGINVTGFGVGFLYYTVIGSKVAAKAANAIAAEAAAIPGVGVQKLRDKYRQVARMISIGRHAIVDGVNAIQVVSESMRIYVTDEDNIRNAIGSGTSWVWSPGSKGSVNPQSQEVEPPLPALLDEETGKGATSKEANEANEARDEWETPVLLITKTGSNSGTQDSDGKEDAQNKPRGAWGGQNFHKEEGASWERELTGSDQHSPRRRQHENIGGKKDAHDESPVQRWGERIDREGKGAPRERGFTGGSEPLSGPPHSISFDSVKSIDFDSPS